MKTRSLIILYVLLTIAFLITNIQTASTQCNAAPAVASCSVGNGAATNGSNVNAGQTFSFSGGTTVFPSGVSLNGGTLRVCGDLILQSINFNQGSALIIEKGGKVTIKARTTMNLNGGGSIVNRGTLIIDGDLTTQNINNIVWNDATTAVFEVTGTFNINGVGNKFINKGKATFGRFLVQDGVSICTYENSCMTTNYYQNNFGNSILYSGVPGGHSVISVKQEAQLNTNVTTNSAVIACMATGAIQTGSKALGWGAATIKNNCSGCAFALPININFFKAVRTQSSVQLQWETVQEISENYFIIERSLDGEKFTEVLRMESKKFSGIATTYTAVDASPIMGACYYRLKQVNMDGKSKDFNVIKVQAATSINEFSLYPTLVKGTEKITFTISTLHAEKVKVYVLSSDGKPVVNHDYSLPRGTGSFTFNMPSVAAGIYYLHVTSTNADLVYSKKIMVSN